MPELIQCPQCDKKLKIPDEYVGKKVKCPSCAHQFIAEADEPEELEAVEEEAPPIKKAKRVRRLEQEDEGRPRSRRAVDDDEDDEDVDEEEVERRPRRRRRRIRRDYVPHRGATILTLGILSFCICGLIFGPIAWSMGTHDLEEMRQGRMDPAGEGVTNAGRICGLIGAILTVVGIILRLAGFGLFGLGRGV